MQHSEPHPHGAARFNPATSRRAELFFATVVASLPLLAMSLLGDPLFLGGWYYIAVFAALLTICALLRPGRLFTLGATLALLATFAGYWAVAVSRAQPDGLLGLGHLFSLPGAAVGLLGGWLMVRKERGYAVAMAVGFGAVLLGFLVTQLMLCNSLMWCGPMTFSS